VEDAEKADLRIEGVKARMITPSQLPELRDHREGMRKKDEIRARAGAEPQSAQAVKRADALMATRQYKAYGRLRIWPWYEYRGPNPYLVVTEREYREDYYSGFLTVQ